jgi:hypothetical protein
MATHDDPRHRSPPRAEPLQPDRPGRGSDRQTPDDGQPPAKGEPGGTEDGARKQKQQSEDALENVREGYGGG